jgi:hypothetical protein
MTIFLEASKPGVPPFERGNVDWGHLAQLIVDLFPDIDDNGLDWHMPGNGLNGRWPEWLADELDMALQDGRIDAYLKIEGERRSALPNEECAFCGGTGVRTDEVGRRRGQPAMIIGPETRSAPDHPRYGEKGWCNACGGFGWIRPFQRYYGIGRRDVLELIRFLRASGGFWVG